MALDMTAGRHDWPRWATSSRAGSHLLAIDDVEPVVEARDVAFTWYVGLDAQGSKIGDDLWNGEELDDAARRRIVGLYRLTFRDPGPVLDKARGEPIYLIMAMTSDGLLRVKPQNLVTGLPIKQLEGAS
jgi:hypothetical protein